MHSPGPFKTTFTETQDYWAVAVFASDGYMIHHTKLQKPVDPLHIQVVTGNAKLIAQSAAMQQRLMLAERCLLQENMPAALEEVQAGIEGRYEPAVPTGTSFVEARERGGTVTGRILSSGPSQSRGPNDDKD